MKKEKMKEMDVVFLLDRSGSMTGMEMDTIGGYNSYLEKQRRNGYKTKITTVLFDDKYEMINERCDIKDIKPLNKDIYYVRGCTALLDAIGKTIEYIDKKNAKKVMFIITTDGLENASKIYNKKQIKEMIEGHSNFEFMYIGANIDSYSEGNSIGISKKNISNYKKSSEGISNLYKSVEKASMSLYEEGIVSNDWKDELEK